jgi:hypothetical protein
MPNAAAIRIEAVTGALAGVLVVLLVVITSFAFS